MNLFEDKTIDFDNRPFGIKLQFDINDSWQFESLLGVKSNYHFYSPVSKPRIPDGKSSYNMGGANINYSPESGTWGISSYVTVSRFESDIIWKYMSYQNLIKDTLNQFSSMINPGFVFSIYQDTWDGVVEVSSSLKRFDKPLIEQQYDENNLLLIDSQNEQFTKSIYGQINWYPEWFTLLAEYKRYGGNISKTEDKTNLYQQANYPLPFQMGPTGVHQHDIGLLGNVTHAVDYSDEVGMFIEIKKDFNHIYGTFSYANMSRIKDWDSDSDELWFPKENLSYFPFVEYYAELEASSEKITNRSVVAFTKSTESGEEWNQHITFTPLYLSWILSDNFVFNLIATTQSSKRGEHQYQSQQYTTSIDFGSKLSIAGIIDTSNDPELIGDGQWLSGEITLKPKSSMWIRASYGEEKGGVRCTSGVCRVISPFEGFRLAMEVRF